jgi:membrane protease YdiL (CAAX protease family)
MAAGHTAISNAADPAAIARRRRDWFDLSVGYGLILLVIWTPNPFQRPLYLIAALFILAASWRSFESRAAMGLGAANFPSSLWVVGLALLGSAIAVAIAHHLRTLRPWHGPVELLQRFWGYAIWSFAQQFLLVDYFLPRLRRLVPGQKYPVALAAGIFAFAHLPSPILTIATLAWGVAACLLFLRYRNLYTLAMTHAILGITIAICFPGPVTHNMRVGLGYLAYTSHPHHHRNPGLPQPYRP